MFVTRDGARLYCRVEGQGKPALVFVHGWCCDTRYFALASNFTPSEPGLKQLAMDRLMDRVFKAGNDLVVPTEGVFADNGSKYFPIEQRFVFQGSDGIAHTGFFANRGARDKIMEWLSA